MIKRLKKWITMFRRWPAPTVPKTVAHIQLATSHNDKEIIFDFEGFDISRVCHLLHKHAVWIGQNGLELEKFEPGWQTGGVVRYLFKNKTDALHFKITWAGNYALNFA